MCNELRLRDQETHCIHWLHAFPKTHFLPRNGQPWYPDTLRVKGLPEIEEKVWCRCNLISMLLQPRYIFKCFKDVFLLSCTVQFSNIASLQLHSRQRLQDPSIMWTQWRNIIWTTQSKLLSSILTGSASTVPTIDGESFFATPWTSGYTSSSLSIVFS